MPLGSDLDQAGLAVGAGADAAGGVGERRAVVQDHPLVARQVPLEVAVGVAGPPRRRQRQPAADLLEVPPGFAPRRRVHLFVAAPQAQPAVRLAVEGELEVHPGIGDLDGRGGEGEPVVEADVNRSGQLAPVRVPPGDRAAEELAVVGEAVAAERGTKSVALGGQALPPGWAHA